MATATFQDEPTTAGAMPADPVDNPSGRPDHVPEKFWDAEKGEVRTDAVLKSYTELEKRLGAPQQQPAEPQQNADEPSPEAREQGEQVANILEANGLDPQRFNVEIEQNGSLSEESYSELESKGFTRDMVDQYLAGAGLIGEYAEVLTESQLESVYSSVGGEESFNAMSAWAAQNVDESALETYNDMVNSGNPAQAQAAVTWIKSMYTDANGSEPNLLNGESNQRDTVEPFRSTAQITEAMRDPRYKSDPAYREDVARRLYASDL